MKYAVIDVGSNSIRLLTCEIGAEGIISSQKQIIMTRLGKGVDASKCLADDRMADSVKAIKTFKEKAQDFGAAKIYIMATSAVRDAENKADFLNLVERETDLKIEVLSGNKEAEVGYMGVLKGLKNPTKEIVVLDIGGGSTEIILGDHKEIITGVSHNIGAVRMTDKFGDEPNGETCVLSEYMQDYLKGRTEVFEATTERMLVGIGGTITTFGAMALGMREYEREIIHNYALSRNHMTAINQKLSMMSIKERKTVAGLDPKRADIIVAGGTILSEVMLHYGYEQITISDYDNLEGYLYSCLSN